MAKANLNGKINWAIEKIAAAEEGSDIKGLLLYIRKIYPNRRIPAWAREQMPAWVLKKYNNLF